MVGPVALNPSSALRTFSHKDKLAYLGKRRVAAGGKEPMTDNSDEDAEGGGAPADVGGDGLEPISFHWLPVDVTLDFVKAFQVRHVVDFTPTPLPLALELVKLGVSYFGVCRTENQRTVIKHALHKGIVAKLQIPASPCTTPATCRRAHAAACRRARAGAAASADPTAAEPAQRRRPRDDERRLRRRA